MEGLRKRRPSTLTLVLITDEGFTHHSDIPERLVTNNSTIHTTRAHTLCYTQAGSVKLILEQYQYT